ncbi:hypothetical protein F4802DRAFT_611655 [Xylaria palmicola]|nr:hypothetical protein F4802DRAFT_611655 [Xylaria palmicola]
MKNTETRKKVLVIGATRNQGFRVVRHCAAADIEVYALSRDLTSAEAQKLQIPPRDARRGREQLEDETGYDSSCRHLKYGIVHLVQGDLNDTGSLMRASQGMDAILFFTMPRDARIEQQQTQNVLEAARASGSVSMVIYSSAAGTDRCDSFPRRGTWNPMEQYWLGKQGNEALVRQLSDETPFKNKIDWVIVRPTIFLQCFVPPISNYLFPHLFAGGQPSLRVAYRPETRLELIDARDVGLVVAATIMRPTDWAGKAVSLVVDRLTIQEIADTISDVHSEETGQGPLAGRAERVKVDVEYVDSEVLQAEIRELAAYSQRLINEIEHLISPCEKRDEMLENIPLTSVKSFFLMNSSSGNGTGIENDAK